MNFPGYFPIYEKLTKEQQDLLQSHVSMRNIKKGTIVYSGTHDCLGLLILLNGQLRAHIVSEEGREITIYRLFERDICLFSASCMMRSIQFDITITAEKDTQVWLIPVDIFKVLMEQSATVANFTSELMGTRLTDTMWLIEQIMWKSFDKRLADFLMEESEIEESLVIKITHEQIASHLGTAREVVTRMLKYFQGENMVKLTRGIVEITDLEKLRELSV